MLSVFKRPLFKFRPPLGPGLPTSSGWLFGPVTFGGLSDNDTPIAITITTQSENQYNCNSKKLNLLSTTSIPLYHISRHAYHREETGQQSQGDSVYCYGRR